MSEVLIDPASLIPEARRFEQQMDRVIQRGHADTWQEAEDELIAAAIATRVSPVRRHMYEERQNTLKYVTNEAAKALHDTFIPPAPRAKAGERIEQPGLIAEINEALDQGLPASIAGFQRQGKTSLAFAVGESRQGLLVHADAQSASLSAGHFPDFMAPAAYSRHKRLGSVIKSSRDSQAMGTLWSELNDYAERGDERFLVCFDEIGILGNANLAEYREQLAEEIAEVAGLSNLDLLIIEHIGDGGFMGEQLGILPPHTKRFIAAPVSGPDVFDFLRMHTREQRITFTPEAAMEIHALTGGRLAMAALVGENAIRLANEQDEPHFIYSAEDVKDWEASYDPGSHLPTLYGQRDDLLYMTDSVLVNLSDAQRTLLETIAQNGPGLPYRGASSPDIDFLMQTHVIRHNLQYGRLEITSRLLKKLLPASDVPQQPAEAQE